MTMRRLKSKIKKGCNWFNLSIALFSVVVSLCVSSFCNTITVTRIPVNDTHDVATSFDQLADVYDMARNRGFSVESATLYARR